MANNAFDFAYNEPQRGGDELSRSVAKQLQLPQVPTAYRYAQSMNQQFFFVEEATVDGEALSEGDWIISYNGDVVVGARMWTGEYTDVPVMGYDGYCYSGGYIFPGEYPYFKVYDNTENAYYYAFPSEDIAWQPFAYEIILPTQYYIKQRYRQYIKR